MKKLIITRWVLHKRVLFCMWSEKELGKHADLCINYMHGVSYDQGSIYLTKIQ